jgi:glycerol-3-phosphate cytidylyltransferase-like family protein
MDFETRIKTVTMSGLGDEVIQAPLKATPEFVAQHDIDFVCHGSDWTDAMVEEYYGEMHRMGKLKIVPHTPGISTTDIIKRIKARNDIP